MQGTYDDIINSGIDFAGILSKTDSVDNENSSEVNKSDSKKSLKNDENDAVLVIQKETCVDKAIPLELETSSKGKIEGPLLLNYFRSANQPILLGILIGLFLMAQILASASDVWVADW